MRQYRLNEAALASLPAGQRARAIKELELIDRLREDNPMLFFEPIYEEQAAFLAATQRLKMFAGGNQSGKTTIGLADDIIQAVDRDALPAHLLPYKHWQPPFRCRIISPDFTSTMEGVIYEKLRELLPKGQLLGGTWGEAYDKSLRLLRFKNGSHFQFLTAEQDVDKHSGATLDRVHFDEEPPGDKGRMLFQENKMRVLRRDGQVMFTMTPLFGMSWTYDEIYERRHEPGIIVVTADMDKNSTLSEQAKATALDGMTEEEKQARKEGRFVHFHGQVLPEFDEYVHVVPEPQPGFVARMDTIVGIDPGVKTTGVIWVGFDRDNAALVYDELYLHNATVEATAAAIRERNRHWQVEPLYYVIDPSARNRTLVNHEQVQGAFVRAGIPTVAGQNAKEVGVFQIKRRLQAKPCALLITRNCVTLKWEINRWRMEQTDDGSFKTVPGDDHLTDPLRYVLMQRLYGAPSVEMKARRRSFDESWPPRYKPYAPDLYGDRGAPVPSTGAMT